MGRARGGWTSIKQHELKYSGHNWVRRTDYTTTILGNKVYIIGGKVTVRYQDGELSDDCDFEDETTGIVNVLDLETWGPHEEMVSLNKGRHGHTCSAISGKLYVAGGFLLDHV